jgi:hypothetical protein
MRRRRGTFRCHGEDPMAGSGGSWRSSSRAAR